MSITHESVSNYKIYYLEQAQYDALVTTGSITVDGQTITYDPNAEYRTTDTTEQEISALSSQINQKAAATSVPNAGSVSSAGVISIKHDTTELFTVQLPLYNGGVSNGT